MLDFGSGASMSAGLDSDDLLSPASDFVWVSLALPDLAPGFFLSSGCAFSSPFPARLVARAGPAGLAPTDLR